MEKSNLILCPGPYVYKLYAYYGFKESQIAVLYVAGFASSVLFGKLKLLTIQN